MNEEQKVKEKAKAMLDYFQTTYERDLFATRCQPPENMQRKSNKVLYDRMWGGSRQNMLHSVNKKNIGYPPTTEMLRTQPLLDHLAATRSRDVAGDAARRAAALPAPRPRRVAARKFRRCYYARPGFCSYLYSAAVRTDAEHFSRSSQRSPNLHSDRVRAAEDASRDRFHRLEPRHGLVEIVERGAGVLVERLRVSFPHRERVIMRISEDTPCHRNSFA